MDVLGQINVSTAGLEKLRQFQALVEKWTPRINLISKSSVTGIWERHIIDSARLCLIPGANVRKWVDLGAGGGFPGIVVAILLQDQSAGTEVVLVESDLRKATFLREAGRLLAVSVTVISERAEKLAPQGADVVSARALAGLAELCGLAVRHLAPGGICLFPKGERAGDEVAEARKSWRFDLETVGNLDHKGSALLVLRNLDRAD